MKRKQNGVYQKASGEVFVSHWAYNRAAPDWNQLCDARELHNLAVNEGVIIEQVPTEFDTPYKTVFAYPLTWLNRVSGVNLLLTSFREVKKGFTPTGKRELPPTKWSPTAQRRKKEAITNLLEKEAESIDYKGRSRNDRLEEHRKFLTQTTDKGMSLGDEDQTKPVYWGPGRGGMTGKGLA